MVDWGNTELTKKSYVENGEYLGVSAAGCDGRMKHFEHEVGTVVLSAIGANCGRVFYPNEKFTAIKNTITFTPDKKKLYPKFLFYILKNNTLPKRGGGQPFMTKGDVKKYKIPLPPLEVQKEIVEQIEVKQKAIEAAKAVIESLERERRYFGQSLRPACRSLGAGREIKDVEWVELREVAEEIKSGFACGKSEKEKGDILHIRPMNITTSGKLTLEGSKYISNEFIKNKKDYFIKKDDVLFNNTNSKELIGKTCFIGDDIVAVYSNHITRIRTKKNCNPKYLSLVIHSLWNEGLFMKLCNKWVGQAGVGITELSKVKIPLPPLETQNQLVAEMEEQEKIIEANKKLIGIMEQKIAEVLNDI